MNAFAFVFAIVGQVAIWITVAWVFTSGELKRELWYFQHYFSTPTVVVYDCWLFATDGHHWWYLLFAFLYTWIWWKSRHDNDDDDRWKRRRKKVEAKVKVLAGKLVVVPLPQPTS